MPVRSVYVDVDKTLIDTEGNLYKGVEDTLNQWKNLDYTIICWSHGGREHAENVCKRHKIHKYFDLFLDKPDLIVDDDPDFILVYPKIMIAGPDFWTNSSDRLFSKKKKEDK